MIVKEIIMIIARTESITTNSKIENRLLQVVLRLGAVVLEPLEQ